MQYYHNPYNNNKSTKYSSFYFPLLGIPVREAKAVQCRTALIKKFLIK